MHHAHGRIGSARLEKQTSNAGTNGDCAMTNSKSNRGARIAEPQLRRRNGCRPGAQGASARASAAELDRLLHRRQRWRRLGYRGKCRQSRWSGRRHRWHAAAVFARPEWLLAGGQIGYDYQSGNFLVGLEGDGDWSKIKGTTPCLVVFSCSANMRWTADATVRALAFCRSIICSSTSKAARRGPM